MTRLNRRVTAAYEAEGYTGESDGEVRRDTKAMKEAAFEAFGDKVATSKLDKAANAITQGELYTAVFPKGPGADGDVESLEPEDQATYKS